jgi:TPP-dependent pyruvate/acetoin dehydrogenase alpha subunit
MESSTFQSSAFESGSPPWLYERMSRIRAFELAVADLHKRGLIPGATHLYIGQEAVAVGACAALRDSDKITSTHRGHGHLIAKGADVSRMMAEILGKRTGYCGGKGGSMHICDSRLGILGANGIVGGGIAIATGAGLADAILDRDEVTICFFGDGAANQGVLHEALNLSALWRLPVIYICENNQYNEHMPTAETTSGRIVDRGMPFGVPTALVDGNDVHDVEANVSAAVARARKGGGPSLIEASTYRVRGHQEGEEGYGVPKRPAEEITSWEARDPIVLYRGELTNSGAVQSETLNQIDAREHERVEAAVQWGLNSATPQPDEAFVSLYA